MRKSFLLIFIIYESCFAVCYDELGQCDPNSLSQAKTVIDILNMTIVDNYKGRRIPRGVGAKKLEDQLNSYASLINDYNKCLGLIPKNHICGENGYDRLSSLWDKLSIMPTKTNDEIIEKNKVVKKYNWLSKEYKSCPRKFIPCELNLHLVINETEFTYEKLTSGQLRNTGKCVVILPDKRFSFVFDKKSNKHIYNKINGLIKLKENYSCQIDGSPHKSNRKIQPLKNKIAIFDDVEGVKFPTMIEYYFDHELRISHDTNYSTFKWGENSNSPYIKINRESGLIIENNMFGDLLHVEQSCKTSSKEKGSAPKLNNLKGLRFKLKRG